MTSIDLSTADQFAPSFAQQRLWFLEQFEPGTGVYNIPAAWRIEGPLDTAALAYALNAIVQRHEVLRTIFASGDDGPVQLVLEQVEIPVPCIAPPAGSDADAWMRGMVEQEARRPFDLATPPLLRATLLRLGPLDHVFLLTLHHIVFDGWSLGILTSELGRFYRDRCEGRATVLEELPVQYIDYAAWQREWMEGTVLERLLTHWRGQLENAPVLLELPCDRIRPAVLGQQGAIVEFTIDAPLCAGLAALARQAHTTLFSTLMSAYAVLLHRHTHQADLCIGYPVAGRSRKELEGLIGLFVNTLVLRVPVRPEQSFLSLLGEVRERLLDADAHQELPFEKLVEALRPGRHLSAAPLFQTMLSLTSVDGQRTDTGLALQGTRTTLIPNHSGTAKFDISVELVARQEAIHGALEYNTALFDHATAAALAGRFTTLLAAIVAAPAMRIDALPLLERDERQRLLLAANDTQRDFSHLPCVVAQIEAQARQAPAADAVEDGKRRLSYRELNSQANQLARWLRQLGVGPDRLVAIGMERGADMVIGMLAVLKAGGAYLPLDPGHPVQRLDDILRNAGDPVVLTHDPVAGKFAHYRGELVILDHCRGALAQLDDTDLCQRVRPDHLAYCIHTSGSSGVPKGVLVTHGGLANLVQDWNSAHARAGAERHSLWTAFGFDVSLWEWLLPLTRGAAVCMVPEEVRLDPQRYLQWLAEQHITCAYLPPHVARLLQPGAALPAHLLVGVEALNEDALHAAAGGSVVVNGYGPSEATVYATTYREALRPLARNIPIGKPIANTQAYVLDQRLQPVPPGVAGELYLAGAGLARGYLNQPDLTAEKFVPNPYGPPGSRMYRTGDLARYLQDGNLEFLGRVDLQVKLNGFRIELTEIEAALLRQDAVREAAVLLREDAGGKRLVAYVSLRPDGASPTGATLQAALALSLPHYMVPSTWVFVAALPLNASGKLDRRALATLPLPAPAPGAHVAPVTPLQQRLARLWAELLDVAQIGLHDNFFASGGHSLLLAPLTLKVKQEFGVTIPVKTIYVAQDLRSFADLLEKILAQQHPHHEL
ncbi:non-ribosomal peptide synthetase [Pseudoduganella armeniaca]|uniref:Carrier domain-containing protein n=1 Tax=Pseudoduganella armeniaca TaxID=2072590 RepID=A0A2R4CH06_9BURK|nr:non-ribosomal peptide synthetase [Pseudoduganella armeniaca]AVR98933.1 hypothetical protein C9I28_27400 [Pseudoduganella armeniaca]